MEHPKSIGDRTTLAVMLALQAAGFDVYAPFGENTRCDLIVDNGTALRRIQCKTGRLRQGGVRFAVCSCYGHHRDPKTARRDYHRQVDCFGVYCPETAGVYIVPIEDLQTRTQAILRVSPPRNNQRLRVRLASDYEVGRVKIEQGPTARLAGRSGAGAPCV